MICCGVDFISFSVGKGDFLFFLVSPFCLSPFFWNSNHWNLRHVLVFLSFCFWVSALILYETRGCFHQLCLLPLLMKIIFKRYPAASSIPRSYLVSELGSCLKITTQAFVFLRTHRWSDVLSPTPVLFHLGCFLCWLWFVPFKLGTLSRCLVTLSFLFLLKVEH